MKRSIYLILGFISVISYVGINAYLSLWIQPSNKDTSFWMVTLAFAISLIITFLFLMLISIPFFSSNRDPFYFAIFTLKYRKIYHSELGDFYMHRYNNGTKFKPGDIKVTIYHQGYLSTKELFELKFDGDIARFRNEVKSKLDEVYKDILTANRLKKTFDVWDGYLDRQSKRDDILTNKLKIK